MDNQSVLLLPFGILEFVLAITALIHVIKHPNYRFGNKFIWILVVLFITNYRANILFHIR